jgi:hypothetical protein
MVILRNVKTHFLHLKLMSCLIGLKLTNYFDFMTTEEIIGERYVVKEIYNRYSFKCHDRNLSTPVFVNKIPNKSLTTEFKSILTSNFEKIQKLSHRNLLMILNIFQV